MSVRGAVSVGLVVTATLAACGSSGGTSASGTRLEVEGVATSGTVLAPPDTSDTAPPIPDPSDAPEVDISGTVDCDGARPTGTGMYANSAAQVCLELTQHQGVFATVGVSDDEACAEVFGGPQHATIKGSLNGDPVDVSLDRSNSCGIQDWTTLEWLLGPPER